MPFINITSEHYYFYGLKQSNSNNNRIVNVREREFLFCFLCVANKKGKALMPLKSFLRIHRIDNDPRSMIYCLLFRIIVHVLKFFSIFSLNPHISFEYYYYKVCIMICVAGVHKYKFYVTQEFFHHEIYNSIVSRKSAQ